ncbi:hypothetical protein evm_004764 [Chilo suppressalis]|nr:hypothetical protein evm_004764 [Chilo suppressalis]
MSSKEVMDTVKTIVSSEYIRQLANEFAVKAAEYILNEIKIKDSKKTEAIMQAQPTTENFQIIMEEPKQTMIGREQIYRPPDKITRNHDTLDDDESLLLLEAPFADGDNLDRISVLSNEDTNEANAPIPVVSLMKINGVYYRRLLGVLRKK